MSLKSMDDLARHLASCLLKRTVAEQQILLDHFCQALEDADVANSMVRCVHSRMGAGAV